MILRWSDCETFLRCRRRWDFTSAHRQNLGAALPKLALHTGSLVHAGMAALFLFAFHVFSQSRVFAWEPERSGEGVVTEKWSENLDAGMAYWVRLKTEVTGEIETRTLTGETLLDVESWEFLAVDQVIGITFRPHKSKPEMRIESIGDAEADAAP